MSPVPKLEYSLLKVKVVANSSSNSVAGWLGETLKLRVTAPPEKGKANEAVISLLISSLGIGKEQVSIECGNTSPRKVIKINGLSALEVRKLIAEGTI